MDCSPPGSSVRGISQARILEWIAISFSRGSSQPRDQTCIFCIGRWILQYLTFIYVSDSSYKQRAPQRHRSSPCFSVTYYGESEGAQLCPTLCNSMDCSLPGSSVHRIFQERVLEWVAVSFLQGTFPIQGSNLGHSHCTVKQTLYHLSHQGSITYYRA